MEKRNDIREIPSTVIRLVQRAEEVDPKQVAIKMIFNTSVIMLALIIWGVDTWFILQGQVTTEPGKRLAIFVVFCAGIMLIVGLMSLFALGMSTVSYLRLRLLIEKAEVEEAAEENVALIDAVGDALPTLAENQREVFVRRLTSAKSLEQHPELTRRIKQELAPAAA